MKREIVTLSRNLIYGAIAAWVVSFGLFLIIGLSNGRLISAFDQSASTITIAELEAGVRPEGRNVTITGARFGELTLNTTHRSNKRSESAYYHTLHGRKVPGDGVARVVLRTENFQLPDNSSYEGRLSLPDSEGGSAWDQEFAALFAQEGIKVADNPIYLLEGVTWVGDMTFVVIAFLVALIVSLSISIGLLKEPLMKYWAFRKDPYSGVPEVKETFADLQKRLVRALLNHAPEDPESELRLWSTWGSLKEEVRTELTKDDNEVPLPEEIRTILVDMHHLYYRQDRDGRFSYYASYDEDQAKWGVRGGSMD